MRELMNKCLPNKKKLIIIGAVWGFGFITGVTGNLEADARVSEIQDARQSVDSKLAEIDTANSILIDLKAQISGEISYTEASRMLEEIERLNEIKGVHASLIAEVDELSAEFAAMQAIQIEQALQGLTQATVTRVIDGDTIEADINGTISRIRFIGVDAPERNEARGPAATNFVNNHIPVGSNVWLQSDGEDTDVHGRLRRYIWTQLPTNPNCETQITNKMLNAMIIDAGYASMSTFRHFEHINLFGTLMFD